MKKFIFILSSVFFVLNASAQNAAPKGFVEGTVITTGNDTIRGYIKYRNKEEVLDKVTVMLDAETKKTLKAADIKSFSADEDYVSHKLDGNNVFMKVMTVGYYSLYEYQLPAEQGGKFQLYYSKEGGKFQMINVSNWKKQVEALVADNTQLVEALKKKQYTLETLSALFETYNSERE